MSDLSEPERLVRDVLVELDAFATTGHVMPTVFDKRARELVAALRPLLTDEPEIVHGAKAATVPNGTLLIRCTTDGEPFVDHTAFRMDGFARPSVLGSSPQSYRVLWRAPAPAPKVGDVVHTEAELERLPTSSVVRVNQPHGAVGTKHVNGRFLVHGVGQDLLDCLDAGLRVLDLGDAS